MRAKPNAMGDDVNSKCACQINIAWMCVCKHENKHIFDEIVYGRIIITIIIIIMPICKMCTMRLSKIYGYIKHLKILRDENVAKVQRWKRIITQTEYSNCQLDISKSKMAWILCRPFALYLSWFITWFVCVFCFQSASECAFRVYVCVCVQMERIKYLRCFICPSLILFHEPWQIAQWLNLILMMLLGVECFIIKIV